MLTSKSVTDENYAEKAIVSATITLIILYIRL